MVATLGLGTSYRHTRGEALDREECHQLLGFIHGADLLAGPCLNISGMGIQPNPAVHPDYRRLHSHGVVHDSGDRTIDSPG